MSQRIVTDAGPITFYGDGTVVELEDARVFTHPSRSNPDILYRVMFWAGKWHCSCIGYRNHKHCYHIDEVRKAVSD